MTFWSLLESFGVFFSLVVARMVCHLRRASLRDGWFSLAMGHRLRSFCFASAAGFYRVAKTHWNPVGFLFLVTPSGIEPELPPWKGGVLTAWPWSLKKTGNVLLSQAASHQVSSALRSLTTVFEMGTGVTSSLLSPDFSLVSFALCGVSAHSLRCSCTFVHSAPRSSRALHTAKHPSRFEYFCTLKTK